MPELIDKTQDSQNQVVRELPNASTVLIMGILSLVMCGPIGLVLGIIGLLLGKKAIVNYDQNPSLWTESSFKNLKAGKTCSMIGVILSSIMVVVLIAYFIFIFWLISGAANSNLDPFFQESENYFY